MFGIMKLTPLSLILALAFAGPALAQDNRPSIQIEPPDPIETPDATPEPENESIIDSEEALEPKPDYSDLTEEAERSAKLNSYFERLKAETNPEDANLIAEDIWAIWLDSGSDCLLYTSPSPRDQRGSRMPSSA